MKPVHSLRTQSVQDSDHEGKRTGYQHEICKFYFCKIAEGLDFRRIQIFSFPSIWMVTSGISYQSALFTSD